MKDHTPEGSGNLPPAAALPLTQLTAAQQALVMSADLLQGVTPAAVHRWLTEAPVRRIPPGETLIQMGVAHDTLFILLSGELSVWLESPDADAKIGTRRAASANTRKQISRICPGETAGEQSLIALGEPQLPTAWAIAHEACEVLAVPALMFWDSM